MLIRVFPMLACLVVFGSSLVPQLSSHEPAVLAFSTGTPGANASVISGVVLLNGESTATADSVATALPVSFSAPWELNITWSSHGGKFGTPQVRDIRQAELQLYYLGSPITTDETTSAPGIPMSSGAFEFRAGSVVQLRYVLEGAYECFVRLLDSNGSSVWSTAIFVHAAAPYHLTALSIGLVALILAVVAGAVRSVPRAPRPAKSDDGQAEARR